MWSIENSDAVGSGGRADALRLPTFQNLTPQFVSDERYTVSDSGEASPSFLIPLSANSAELNRQAPVNRKHPKSQKTNTRDPLKSPKSIILQHHKVRASGTIHRTPIVGRGLRLTGSALQTESDVTHSKQSRVVSLTEARTAQLGVEAIHRVSNSISIPTAKS
jgi:hypothetical protein